MAKTPSFLKMLFRGDNLENPSNPFTINNIFGTSGLGRDKAMMFSPVWYCVSAISQDVGKLPLDTFKRTSSGKKKATDLPAFNLLRKKPNQFMTASIFKETLQAHALNTGSGYGYIFRNKAGLPTEIIILNPDNTYPVTANGVLWYVTTIDSKMHKLKPENVFHLRGLGFDGLNAYSVIEYANTSISQGQKAQEYSDNFFKNSARPSVLLMHPKSLKEEAQKRLKTSWDQMYQGVQNQHKTAVLEDGMNVQFMNISARDSQLIESLDFSAKDVARWYKVPASMLGVKDSVSYNSLEQESLRYLGQALDPWLVKWEEESWDKLLTEEQKRSDNYFMEFNRNAIIRVDMKSRFEAYSKSLAGASWMAINEIRGLENLNNAENEKFNEIILPSNNFGNPDAPTNTRSVEIEQDIKDEIQARMEKLITRIKKRYEKCKEKDTFFSEEIEKDKPIVEKELKKICDIYDKYTESTDSYINNVDKIIQEIKHHAEQ